jgi:hypothetical protein
MRKAKAIRRVVTGHRADGRSTVLRDTPAPNVKQRQAGNASTLLWVTEETPALVSGAADRAAREIGVPPPRRGSVFRDNETVLRDFGIGAGDVVVQRGTNHAWINRGDTVCRLGMVFIDAEEPAELAALR